jgi:G6PDH family F420-dependent oxidoreductase
MPSFGYTLSSEEHAPRDLVRNARMAEEAGFEFLSISDHYHPWIDRQGHSPFVWGVVGAIASVTEKIRLGTGVTCPMIRIHPAIIAQAAATAGCLMPGRFFLGVGSGENLNEHITGARWPEYDVRAAMLEESVEVIRLLWEGGVKSHHGTHYTVENARVYDLPDPLPEIIVAASGPKAAQLAGRIGDGLWSTGPDRELVRQFESAGRGSGKAAGSGKGSGNGRGNGRGRAAARPKYAQVSLCWDRSEARARKTALEIWPTAAISGDSSQELPNPSSFESLAKIVTEDDIAKAMPCGPEAQPIIDAAREYLDAGFDHVYFHQIGPNQEAFIDFAAREVLPALTKSGAAAGR